MSRWDALTDARADLTSRAETTLERGRWETVRSQPSRTREPERKPERQGRDWRREVQGRERLHRLRDSEWETIKTVGTFRVVAEPDLTRDARDEKVLRNDLLHLVNEGLLDLQCAVSIRTSDSLRLP